MTDEDRAQIQGLATNLGITYEAALERVCEHLVRAGDNAHFEGADIPPEQYAEFVRNHPTQNIAMAEDTGPLPSGSSPPWEPLSREQALAKIRQGR